MELMHIIHLRWYLNPYHISPNMLLHMWWSCPLFSNFWSDITDLMIELTGCHLTLSPELAILDISLVDIPYHFRTIAHHILLAALYIDSQIMETTSRPSFIRRRVNFWHLWMY